MDGKYKPVQKIVDKVCKIWVKYLNAPELFADHLYSSLLEPDEYGFYPQSLLSNGVAEPKLVAAADAVRWKPNFWPVRVKTFWNDKYVAFKENDEPWVYHYPLPDGSWLVTTLHGSEINKLIGYVQGGRPEFTVEC